jgi:endonuclease/exonuclease/phosphatase family metal-dependent hydrolase
MFFRVSTWNCFGMAQRFLDALTAGRAPSRERFADPSLAAACAAAEVVCIQELFSRDALRFFDRLAGAGLTSMVRDDNRVHVRSATLRGSGLGIGARRSFASTFLRRFTTPCTSWDRFARKGLLHARIELGAGVTFDVLTVHLQAGATPSAAAVRASQLTELAAAVQALGAPERPFVVCGDFNIDGLEHAREAGEYRRLRVALEGFEDLGAYDDHATFDPEPRGTSLARATALRVGSLRSVRVVRGVLSRVSGAASRRSSARSSPPGGCARSRPRRFRASRAGTECASPVAARGRARPAAGRRAARSRRW